MTAPAQDRAALLETLRRRLARIEGAGPAPAGGAVPLAPAIDAALPAGGLARGAVHEVLAADPGVGSAFAALLLGRAGGPVVWIEARPELCPQGLAGFGFDPAALIVVRARGVDALWAAEEALRSPAVAGVLAALPRLDLAAGRRLQLAAETGGALGLVLRPDAAAPAPSGARTRWRIAPLPGAPGPRHLVEAPRWRIELLRARGGRPGCWDVAWHGDTLAVLEAPARAAAHG